VDLAAVVGLKRAGIEVATARVEDEAARRLVCVTLFAFFLRDDDRQLASYIITDHESS
jgi:hypothetical protein